MHFRTIFVLYVFFLPNTKSSSVPQREMKCLNSFLNGTIQFQFFDSLTAVSAIAILFFWCLWTFIKSNLIHCKINSNSRNLLHQHPHRQHHEQHAADENETVDNDDYPSPYRHRSIFQIGIFHARAGEIVVQSTTFGSPCRQCMPQVHCYP